MKYVVKVEAGSIESHLLQELAFTFGYSWFSGKTVKYYGPYLCFYNDSKSITWHNSSVTDNTPEISIKSMVEFIKGEYNPVYTLDICGKKVEIIPNQCIRIGGLDLTDKHIQEIMSIYKSA